MIVKEPGMIRRLLPGWLYRGRDLAEGGKLIASRNSPIASHIHLWAGIGGGMAASVGGAQLLPKHDPNNPDRWDNASYTKATGNLLQAGALIVVLTAGVQSHTARNVNLPRGLNPLYFLGVGSWVAGGLIAPKFEEMYRS